MGENVGAVGVYAWVDGINITFGECVVSGLNVAIMGATGAVGQEMLKTLETRKFPVATLKLLSSARSAGTKVPFRGRLHTVEELNADSFNGIDLVLSSAGGSVSKEFAPLAVAAWGRWRGGAAEI